MELSIKRIKLKVVAFGEPEMEGEFAKDYWFF